MEKNIIILSFSSFFLLLFGMRVNAITYTVTTATDFPVSPGVVTATGAISAGPNAGQVTLRSAIIASNNNAGADIIQFNVSTNGIPFTLAIAGANENGALTGDLDILQALTITGNGPANTIIQAGTNNTNGIDKVFSINPLFNAAFATSITGITIRFGINPSGYSGDGFGGGLDWEGSGTGTLVINNCIITDNKTTDGDGGGLTVTNTGGGPGSVTITNSTISNNSPARIGAASPFGGGIFVGTTTAIFMTNCTVSGNTVAGSNGTGKGGGIFIFAPGGAAGQSSLTNCVISNNTSPTDGGGIRSDAPLTISGTTFSGNSAALGGGLWSNGTGTTTVSKCTFTNNNASTRGGAILQDINVGATINVSFSRFAGNTSPLQKGVAIGAGTGILQNNWWGCNLGPSNAACNQAAAFGAGLINFTPWLVFNQTASPASICIGATSTLTASFLLNSSGGAVLASNLDVLIGQPVTFNTPVNGTLSAAQTSIQASGTATATFTGSAAGTGTANAVFVPATENFIKTTSPAINILPNNTIAFNSGSVNQVKNAGTPITTTNWNTTGAIGASFTSLPPGVTGNWAANVASISGTVTTVGTYNYVVNLTGGCNGGSTGGQIIVSPPLPVTLTSFTGKLNSDKTVTLQWKVEQQQDIVQYIVEESADGITYTQLGAVPASNGTVNTYSYIDGQVATGYNYYRLKIVELSGKISYSKIILVTLKAGITVMLYPNPVTGQLMIQQFGTVQNKTAVLSDGRGNILLQIKLTSQQQTVDMQTYPAGVYIVKLEDGTVFKVMKQ